MKKTLLILALIIFGIIAFRNSNFMNYTSLEKDTSHLDIITLDLDYLKKIFVPAYE